MTAGPQEAEPSVTFPEDRRAWIVVALMAVMVVLAVFLARRTNVQPAPSHANVTDQFKLTILGYGRVVQEPDGLNFPSALLVEHIEALQASGFVPVSLDQVVQAYEGGSGLPPRSVLMTFDGGFLSTYQAADPVLRRFGWPAVMFIETSRQASRDTTYLYWDRLERMVRGGVWHLGARGDRAGTDFDHDRKVIEEEIGDYKVTAATSSGGWTQHALVEILNDVFGVNAPGAEPVRLLRLPVGLGWSGEYLSSRVLSALTPPSAGGELPSGNSPFVRGSGKFSREGEALVLEGEHGAEIWLAGSVWAEDWELQANIRSEAGQFWILSESSATAKRWVWGGDRDGLYLQERIPGTRPRQLSRADRTETGDGWHRMRLVKRGGGLHVEWDGSRIEGSPMRLPWNVPCKVGVAAASVGEGSRLIVADLRFRQVPFNVEPVDADPTSGQIRHAVERADTIAALSPRWLRLAAGGRQLEEALNNDLLAILARTHRWEIYPSIEISDPAATGDRSWCEAIADQVLDAGWDGCRLVFDTVSDEHRLSVEAIRVRLEQALRSRGLKLVIGAGAEPGREVML